MNDALRPRRQSVLRWGKLHCRWQNIDVRFSPRVELMHRIFDQIGRSQEGCGAPDMLPVPHIAGFSMSLSRWDSRYTFLVDVPDHLRFARPLAVEAAACRSAPSLLLP